jgi:hypothetical protein
MTTLNRSTHVVLNFYLARQCLKANISHFSERHKSRERQRKSVKSHLRASILVGPRMHKSFGNYSYMASRKDGKTTRTCSPAAQRAE